ncbi:CAP domain-containing protein [Streptomyces sp. NPDC046261]|uniref:CAP domain-containing protein n=1 Tax=Streptomyces sp. NPDC046261 TaxID=3157200 RepID=UPI0033F0A281
MNREPETQAHATTSDETRRSRRRRDRRPRRAAVVGGTVGLIVVVGGGYGVAQSLTDHKESDTRTDATGTSVQAAPRAAAPSARASAAPSAVTSPSASAAAGSASPSAAPAGKDGKPTPRTSAKTRTEPATDTGKGSGNSAGGGNKGADSARKAPGTGNTSGGAAGGHVQQVVEMVNAERARNGCSPVTVNSKLQAAAQGHSDDMAARDYYDHRSPEGKGPGDRITAAGYRWSTYGENIFKSPKDARTAMEGWMKSPGHRSNILNCAYKEIGVGINFSSNGPWWTQNFAASS